MMAGFGDSGSTSPGADPCVTVHDGVHPVPAFPIRPLLFCLVLTFLLLLTLGWHLWSFYRGLQSTAGRDFNIHQLTGTVVHIDEVLTMSARMAAATGDLHWEERYRTYEPVLASAIKDLTRLASESVTKKAVDQMSAANTKLVEIENKVFDLARRGRRNEATALLSGWEYVDQKKIYAESISEIVAALQHRAEASLRGLQRSLRLGVASGLATIPVILLIWIGVLRSVKRNIAQREQAEEGLRASEERYRGLVELSPEAILVNRNHRIAFTNSAALQLFGATGAEQVLAMPPFDVFHADCRSFMRDRIETLVEGQPAPLVEARIVRLDGAVRDVEVAASAFVDREGSAVQVILRDVTDRKRTEEELEKYREHLEELVEERTAQLRAANEELAKHMAELARSNAELQEFAYVASHDLQEPLRKTLAFGDRLKVACGDGLTEQGRDYMERMLNASRRMQTLITDLLAFSRVTTQARPYGPVDLNEVLRDVLSDLELRIEQTGAHVEAGKLPTIQADPTQMRQLFQNLIGNALKFRRPEANPRIRVWAELADGLCRVAVEDNGIGFEEKYTERIFGIFQRLHGRGEYEGTGIGLALCQKIVKRHGGTITARSTPGQGSTFVVSLPIEHHGASHEK